MGTYRELMYLRTYEPEDYPVLVTWWQAHQWPPVPAEILPKLGLIAFDDHGLVVASWLYMDNSVGVSMLEWTVSNPEASGFRVVAGVKAVTEFLADRARELGYGIMLTTARQPALVRLHERNGFAVTDLGVTHLLKHLTPE